MCGIAGFYNPHRNYLEEEARYRDILKDMAAVQRHRGPDDSGVYARVLTETELDTLRVKSRTFNGNEKRTPELMDRRFKILHLQRALSGWEGLEFEDGSPIPFSKEMIKELWEVNPNLMGIIYSCVSSELSFVKAAEEKNSGTGADA